MQTTAIRTVTNSLPENEVILLTLLISKRYIPYTDLVKKKAIPYIVANRYFLKNGVETLPPQKITNQKDFDSYFGTAAVMDENGNPTDINFSTQYVISLTRPETDIETRLVPKSLETNQKGEIVLCYQEIQGQKRTYTTKPLLLIIVDKKYDGNVVLSKVE